MPSLIISWLLIFLPISPHCLPLTFYLSIILPIDCSTVVTPAPWHYRKLTLPSDLRNCGMGLQNSQSLQTVDKPLYTCLSSIIGWFLKTSEPTPNGLVSTFTNYFNFFGQRPRRCHDRRLSWLRTCEKERRLTLVILSNAVPCLSICTPLEWSDCLLLISRPWPL